ncbi:ester cyclase [Brevundimonas sp.]|uniref:ester cyclase n=1 Tax=Brevundimonas sp. TaxID=1871086 RepID=UPI003568A071
MHTHRRGVLGVFATAGAAPWLGAVPAMASARPSVDIASVMRQFHENYNRNEIDRSGELVVDDVVADINGGAGNGSNGATHRGREAFIAWLKNDKVLFGANRLVHQDLITQGNMGAVRFYMEGTHVGPIPTPDGVIEPTGRRVTLEVTEFATFNDEGKLVHVHTLYNTLGLLMQLKA